MPSPVGHTLGAVAVCLAAAPLPDTRRDVIIRLGTIAMLAIAPDIDLLWGRHSAETHSLGAAAIAAAAAAWLRLPLAATRARIFLVAGLAVASHPVLDAMGRDGTPPLGVMLFWPVSSDYVLAPWRVFDGISRRYWLVESWWGNAQAVAREVVLLAPPAAIAVWARLRVRIKPLA